MQPKAALKPVANLSGVQTGGIASLTARALEKRLSEARSFAAQEHAGGAAA